MHSPSFLERLIIYPIREWIESCRYKVFVAVLRENGMDWGPYALEEITKLYRKYESEIDRNE